MEEKELRKLNRTQLLDLYNKKVKEIEDCNLKIERLKEDLDEKDKRIIKLKEELQDTQYKLKDKTIKISEAGSIAKASLELSGIFEAAQEAADIYTNAIKEKEEKVAQELKEKYDKADAKCEEMLARTRRECDRMREKTINECDKELENLKSRLTGYKN